MLRSAPRRVATRVTHTSAVTAARAPRSQPRQALSVKQGGSSRPVVLRRSPDQRWNSTFRTSRMFVPQADFAASSLSHLGIAAALVRRCDSAALMLRRVSSCGFLAMRRARRRTTRQMKLPSLQIMRMAKSSHQHWRPSISSLEAVLQLSLQSRS